MTCLTLLLLSLLHDAFAQYHYRYEKITVDQGLSDGWVKSILHDSKGFLWVGTLQGLDRYDGYKFKNFPIPVVALHEDKSGKIWIVSDQGLGVFDPSTEYFLSYKNKIDSLGISLRMISIVEDNYDNLWITTQTYYNHSGGLICFNKKDQTFKKFNTERNHVLFCNLIDEYGNLWVGGDGIHIFDPKAKTFLKSIRSDSTKPTHLPSNEISCFFKDKDGSIWAGTWRDGFSIISYNEQYDLKFENIRNIPSQPSSLINDKIFSITRDHTGKHWIATFDGVSVYNRIAGTFSNHATFGESPYSLQESRTHVVYEDKVGTIWLGHSGGLTKIQKNKGFILLSNDLPFTETLRGNYVSAVYSDKSGSVWAAVPGHGIHKLTFKDNDYSNYPDIDFFAGHGRINCITEDSKGNIWFTADEGGGLYCIRKGTRKVLEFNFYDHSISVAEGSKNSLWLMHWGGLTKVADPLSNIRNITPFLPDKRLKSQFKSRNFNKMVQDGNNRVWATNWEGEIYLFDSLANQFYFPEITTLPSFNKESLISTILVTKSNYLWAGTSHGLCKYRIEGSSIESTSLVLEKIFTEKDGFVRNGMPELFSFALAEDIHGNMWVAQRGGLFFIDVGTNMVTSYSQEDGLPTNALVLQGSAALNNGFLAFATFKGLVIFHPDSLKRNESPPIIKITDFLISNESVVVNAKKERDDNRVSLQRSISEETEITLPYNLNVIGFEFCVLDYLAPEKNQFAYQMVGFDKNWVYSNNRRLATYTNLDPGTYTFRVKGSNSDGVWNEKGTSLKINILPPPWRTWWAHTSYGVGLLFILLAGRNEIIKRERLKTKAKIKEAEAEKYHELDTLKSRFFTNISHEFRTPLTLLLGPIEKRLSTASDTTDKNELSTMHKNASRLLTLVNQLLDLSRLESGSLKLKCQWGSLNNAVDFISSQFSSMADSRNIKFSIESLQDIDLYFDFEKLEKIITNLLSNAFKFTQENGLITVSISANGPDKDFKNGFAAVIVKDSGIGINPADLPRIFDRFYQVDSSATRHYEGSGIGLALVKELAELHHGTVTVMSAPGEGTTFTVRLPLGKDHLSIDEISPETGEIKSPQAVLEIEDLGYGKDMEKGESVLPKVLVVEDNADLRHYLRSSLSDRYSIMESKDGEEAFSKAVQEVPDLIISDLMMPLMDGIQLTKKLKQEEKTSHIPIILLTAKADSITKLEGLKTGADDYITKPFRHDELVTRVHNLIAIRRNLQKKYSSQLQLMPSQIEVESMEDRFLKKVMTIIEQHIDDPLLSVDVLAEEAAMSNAQLYRKLKSLTGFSPNELIRNTRLERAASLLKQRAGTVADIAYQVGFNNLSYFSKCFREKFGSSPSEYLSHRIDSPTP